MTSDPILSDETNKIVVLGIDLGTTNSLVAIEDECGGRILGDGLLPSVVAFLEDGTIVVGDAAKALEFELPGRVVHSVKRLIGRSMHELRVEARRLPYSLVEGPSDSVRIRIPAARGAHPSEARDYAPEEISAFVLRACVDRARAELGAALGETPRVVLTVPAYFDEAQRQATKRAAELAGLEVLRLVGEPTAAALAYGVGLDAGASARHVLVYDLGGGTFDVTLLKIQDGIFRVLATHGDTQLGGDDFDRLLLERLLTATGLDRSAAIAPSVLATLRRSAEAVKLRLSDEALGPNEGVTIEVDVAREDATHGAATRGAATSVTITRNDFEAMIQKPLERTLASVRSTLQDGAIAKDDIDAVVLVGGSTRIPRVRAMLTEEFGRPPFTNIDPDRAIALGAARQAAILSGADTETLLLDVVPLSLGIETLGGAFSKLIVRNTTVPCSITEEFSTQVENQSGIEVNIYQGERELVADCRHIGSFQLSGIPPMPAGLPRVAVTFTVDQHGLLRVSARELRSGMTASVEVRPTLGLSEDDVRRMIRESIEKAGEDVVAREALDLRNKATAIIRGTEEALARGGAGLEPEQAYSLKKALARTKRLLDGNDNKALYSAVEELSSYTMQVADDLIGAAVKKALEAPEPQ